MSRETREESERICVAVDGSFGSSIASSLQTFPSLLPSLSPSLPLLLHLFLSFLPSFSLSHSLLPSVSPFASLFLISFSGDRRCCCSCSDVGDLPALLFLLLSLPLSLSLSLSLLVALFRAGKPLIRRERESKRGSSAVTHRETSPVLLASCLHACRRRCVCAPRVPSFLSLSLSLP